MSGQPRLTCTFETLSRINLERCEDVFHPLDAWSPPEWACALGGEAGEALNVVKKYHRGDYDLDRCRQLLAPELADIVLYADLLAQRMGIDLGRSVMDKFNQVSADRGSCWYIIGTPITPPQTHEDARSGANADD